MRKIIIILILIIGAWTAYWFVAKGAIAKGAAQTITDYRAQGYAIEHSPLKFSGYPLRFKTDAGPLMIETPDSPLGKAGLRARLETAKLSAAAYAPASWTLTHSGAAQFDMPIAGARWIFDTKSESADINAKTRLSGELAKLDIIARGVSVTSTGADAPPVKSLGALDYAFTQKGKTASYDLTADAVTLAAGATGRLGQALGEEIERISGVLSVTDYGSATPGYSSERFNVLWGKADLGGGFNLSRSPAGLSGKIALNVNNEQTLISELTRKGILSSGEAMIAGLMIGNLPKAEDGRRQMSLTVTNNVVSLGPIKLGRLPF